jgi:hypothetical protein
MCPWVLWCIYTSFLRESLNTIYVGVDGNPYAIILAGQTHFLRIQKGPLGTIDRKEAEHIHGLLFGETVPETSHKRKNLRRRGTLSSFRKVMLVRSGWSVKGHSRV